MDQTEAPPVSGLVAGKYQLVRMIGRGGMGSVWEARHHQLGTPVAIKFIEPEYADSQEAKSRFAKEAMAAAAIQSKHAIQIHDHGIQDNRPYIVMELLQGIPLDKHVEMHRALSLQETARILQQVCRGLQRAHERGVVHRDLKPENIFLVQTPEDDEPIAKVLDFGIAKVSNSPHNPSVTSSTKTGAVLGTPFYMSPEQARGLRNVDHRTDLWSLGVIAYKCVTGKLPFDGESVGDLLVKICTAPVPRPSDVRSDLPEDFNRWFQRALEREPERRFASAAELAAGLAAAAGVAASPSFSGGNPISSGATIPQQQHAASFTPPQSNYAATPPQAGAATASPFTSSQPIPGVGSSRWKLFAGVAVAMLAIGGGSVAFYMIKVRPPQTTGAGVVAATPPSPPAIVSQTSQADTPPSTPPTPPSTPPETPTQISGSTAPPLAAAGTKTPPKTLPKTSPKTPPVAPPPGTTAAVTPPATPPPATPPTPPTAKKRDKSDPGY